MTNWVMPKSLHIPASYGGDVIGLTAVIYPLPSAKSAQNGSGIRLQHKAAQFHG